MNTQRINNFRMGGYLLLALGLINLRYQGEGSIWQSLILIIPGAILLLMTMFQAGKDALAKQAVATVVLTLGALLVIYGFIN